MSLPSIDPVPPREVAEAHIEPTYNSALFGNHAPGTRYHEATQCESPGCINIVPAGYYPSRQLRFFCSGRCRNHDAYTRYVIGECPYCGGPVMGRKDEAGIKQHCCAEHRRLHDTDQILDPTGPFRSLIEEYMATSAPNLYGKGTLSNVRVSLSAFFRFAVQVEEITTLEGVRPSVITRFIAQERERGLTSRTFVGHLSTFFNSLIAEERYRLVNPVVARIHSQRNAPAEARPYNDSELRAIWDCVEHGDKLQLMLAFVISEECGLRVGEVANIRLPDIDLAAQTIFVRLPTKNKRTRTVPFDRKVLEYLPLWLAKRDPRCPHDHLIHNNASSPFTGNSLDAWFKKLLRNEAEPAASFNFHRLRHTWATNLMNNGMELAVLKVLGGWEKWNSMQRYIRVLAGTIRSQYEASYAKLQEKRESGEDEAIPLFDFALMEPTEPATPLVSET